MMPFFKVGFAYRQNAAIALTALIMRRNYNEKIFGTYVVNSNGAWKHGRHVDGFR